MELYLLDLCRHTAPSVSSTQPTTNQDGLNEETVRRYLRR